MDVDEGLAVLTAASLALGVLLSGAEKESGLAEVNRALEMQPLPFLLVADQPVRLSGMAKRSH